MRASDFLSVYPAHVPPEPREPPIRLRPGALILSEVARETGFSGAILKGRLRYKPISRARQLVMYRIAYETGLGLSGAGRLLNRDHSTVGYGVRAHARRNGLPLPHWMGS